MWGYTNARSSVWWGLPLRWLNPCGFWVIKNFALNFLLYAAAADDDNDDDDEGAGAGVLLVLLHFTSNPHTSYVALALPERELWLPIQPFNYSTMSCLLHATFWIVCALLRLSFRVVASAVSMTNTYTHTHKHSHIGDKISHSHSHRHRHRHHH